MVGVGVIGRGLGVKEMKGKENLPKDTVFENIVITSDTSYPS